MKIGRTEAWYRPYIISVNGRNYRVNKIYFYSDEKIIVTNNNGWLETTDKYGISNDIAEIELPTEEIIQKRKIKFDGTVFIISGGKYYVGENRADLYIPAEMLNVHFVEHKLEYDTQIRAIYKGDQGIYISQYIKSIDGKLNSIRAEYEECYKEISGTSLHVCKSEIVLGNIDRLKQLAEEYTAERKRLASLTIDDIDLTAEEQEKQQ